MDFATWLKAEYGLDEKTLTADQKTKLTAAWEKSKTPPAAVIPAVAATIPAPAAATTVVAAASTDTAVLEGRRKRDADEEERKESINDLFARYEDVKELTLERHGQADQGVHLPHQSDSRWPHAGQG